jgi:hypothetical protein
MNDSRRHNRQIGSKTNENALDKSSPLTDGASVHHKATALGAALEFTRPAKDTKWTLTTRWSAPFCRS